MAQSTQNPPTLYGYHGRYLHVDAGTGQARWVPLPENVLRRFLGGAGLGTWLLLRLDAASADPLSPPSPIAFVFSPLVGSPLTTSAKLAVVSKSPLTGRINDALAGSSFAIAAKATGADAIVITGRASRPSILMIDDGRVCLEPAGELWGRSCRRAEEQLRRRLGAGWQVAVIGPGGERAVRFATISHAGRHAGRGGSGAVLGAKNLKAVAVRGSQATRWADPAGLLALAEQLSRKSFGAATAKYRELGTAANMLLLNRLRALPTRNFQQGSFSQASMLSPESLGAARSVTRTGCAACTIGCEHLYSLNGAGRFSAEGGKVRIEYENLFALGSLCGVGDPDVVLAASARCDQLGIDTISTGGTIAFAMECAERGWLDADWLRFGDGQALLRAIELIGQRKGLGDLLAGGTRQLAERLGPDALRLAPQIKGLEMPGYEPRALQSLALGLAVAARGADHNRSGAYAVDLSERADRRQLTTETAALAVRTEDEAALLDSLILCKFLRGALDDLFADAARMLRLVTGWPVDADQLRQTSRRIVTAKKLFNLRAGWQPQEDRLPERFVREPLGDDPAAAIDQDEFRRAVQAYYRCRGWTESGQVPDSLLKQLQLDDV